MVWSLTAKVERFHGETSRPENQATAGHVAAKPTRKNHVLRSKLTELHSWNMAVESPETSTTTTPIVETKQLETVTSSLSRVPDNVNGLENKLVGKPEPPKHKKNRQTKCMGGSFVLFTDRKRESKTSQKDNEARNPSDLRDCKNMASARSQRWDRPGNKPATQAGDSGPIQDMTGMHSLQTNKPAVKSARRRLRTKGRDPAVTPGGAATNPGNSRMKHSQQPRRKRAVGTTNNSEHCSPLSPNGHSAEDISASVRQR